MAKKKKAAKKKVAKKKATKKKAKKKKKQCKEVINITPSCVKDKGPVRMTGPLAFIWSLGEENLGVDFH